MLIIQNLLRSSGFATKCQPPVPASFTPFLKQLVFGCSTPGSNSLFPSSDKLKGDARGGDVFVNLPFEDHVL